MQHKNRQTFRRVMDLSARHGIQIGGIAVIITITLIFVYLLSVVFPLFGGASMEKWHEITVPGEQGNKTRALALEEQNQLVMRVTDTGKLQFIDIANGNIVQQQELPLSGQSVEHFSHNNPATQLYSMGLSEGGISVFKVSYRLQYSEDGSTQLPQLEFPFGEIVDTKADAEIKLQQVQSDDNGLLAVYSTGGSNLGLLALVQEDSLLDDEEGFERMTPELEEPEHMVDFLLLAKSKQTLFAISREGEVSVYDTSDLEDISIAYKGQLGQTRLKQVVFLTGDNSLLVQDELGVVRQWAWSNTAKELFDLRSFATGHKEQIIIPEYSRKSFVSLSRQGAINLYHTTADNHILRYEEDKQEVRFAAIAPHANGLVLENAAGKLIHYHIDNEHPEVSWSALWNEIWYEGYEEPDYIWQSSSASNDFEPKFSLTPLSFGTIKAAFYAMLLAMPLAILGAAFTAHFMSSRLRGAVKPTIEVMEALPTVIIGFLAGLWLAPFVEKHLVMLFSLTVILPLGILLFAFLFTRLSNKSLNSLMQGWQPMILIPVIVILVGFSLLVAGPMENMLFGGNMISWMRQELGVSFDQRNSIIVGLAMGFAVIPTIFSIAEDAIYSVPKHLVNGSLALGATEWQTFVNVVIPTASPGIFSAVMMGFGRAVGETMIVLMATGNTPIMDLSIFQGMRTLSANIAVEMPESEVGSTHYRILFLAALVLFMFTFTFNSAAEIVRQRLRRKYSTL